MLVFTWERGCHWHLSWIWTHRLPVKENMWTGDSLTKWKLYCKVLQGNLNLAWNWEYGTSHGGTQRDMGKSNLSVFPHRWIVAPLPINSWSWDHCGKSPKILISMVNSRQKNQKLSMGIIQQGKLDKNKAYSRCLYLEYDIQLPSFSLTTW